MTNKKISAFSAATIPLSGTELVPVVQSGATDNVTIANLTAGRTVNMLQGNATNAFQVTKAGSDSPWVGPFLGLDNVGTGAAERHWAWQLSATDQYDLLQYDGSNWNRWFRFTSAGNLTPMAAAKGINFTANTPAAGMTSQLLNWYEEGTWTATLIGSITSPTVPVTATGIYTKIGRIVHYRIVFSNVSTIGASGNFSITGLPFTSAAEDYCGGTITSNAIAAPSVMVTTASSTKIDALNITTVGRQPIIAMVGVYVLVAGTYST